MNMLDTINKRPDDINDEETFRDLLAFELARNKVGADLPTAEVLKRLHVEPETLVDLLKDDSFRRSIKAYRKELEDNGVSFQLRAGIIAEDGLSTLYGIIHDADEPGSTRLKALEKAVDWARLAPKETEQAGMGAAVPTIVFNFPSGVPVPETLTVVDQTADTLPSDNK